MWLTQKNIAYQFHDYKKQELAPALIRLWLLQVGWEKLVNRSGLTWRGLPESEKKAILDNDSALPMLLEKTSAIKRPILEKDGKLLHLGFDEDSYRKIFNL